MVIEEHLAEVPPVSKIVLEKHLASQCDMPPEVVPSSQASVDRIAKFLGITNGRMRNSVSSSVYNVAFPTR